MLIQKYILCLVVFSSASFASGPLISVEELSFESLAISSEIRSDEEGDIFVDSSQPSVFQADYKDEELTSYVTIPEPALAAYAVSVIIFLFALIRRRKNC